MRVITLHRESDSDYSCLCYWVLGDHNEEGDRNTLIDAGSSNLANLGYFMREMSIVPKGIGKMAVEQVILTHEHFDHAGGLPGLDRQFAPLTLSWLPNGARHQALVDGMRLRVGDREALVLHTPGHSQDSICIYVPEEALLFSGDTLFRISDTKGSYPRAYMESLERLSRLEIRTVYPGHGAPIRGDVGAFIRASIENVALSILAD
jgi:glyoxylase-like metal-dependent hydrolase (beta-lactamase superfamily II)